MWDVRAAPSRATGCYTVARMSPRQPERPRQHRRANHPQSGAAATDRRCLMTPTASAAVETSTNGPNGPDRRRKHGHTFAMHAATARRCSTRASGLVLDANLIRKNPADRRRRGSSSAVVTTESETPEWAPPCDRPRRRQQLGAEMNTEKPQQPGRKTDLKFFDLFVGITIAFQPRRLMISAAADGCKRLFGGSCH